MRKIILFGFLFGLLFLLPTIAFAKPDLIIEEMSVTPPIAVVTFPTDITLTIKNIGDATANLAGKEIGYHLDISGVGAESGSFNNLEDIGVGETIKAIIHIPNMWSPVNGIYPTGEYEVDISIDTKNNDITGYAPAPSSTESRASDTDLTVGVIEESDEGNNRLLTTMEITLDTSLWFEYIAVELDVTSPTTQEIVFSDGENLFATDLDGSNLIQLTTEGGQILDNNGADTITFSSPSWSPDGTKISYLYREYGETYVGGQKEEQQGEYTVVGPAESKDHYDRYGLGVLEVSSLNKKTLFFTEDIGLLDKFLPHQVHERLSWGPDSEKIMFSMAGYIPSVFFGDDSLWSHRIYTINSDGTELNMVLKSTASAWDSFMKTYIFRDIYHISSVDWSSDGSKIVFDKRFHKQDNVAYLWTADIDGSNHEQLTFENGKQPEWTCDGEWIVYQMDGDFEATIISSYLVKIRSDGTGQETLTDHALGHSLSSKNKIIHEPHNIDYEYSARIIDLDGSELDKIQISIPAYGVDWKKSC